MSTHRKPAASEFLEQARTRLEPQFGAYPSVECGEKWLQFWRETSKGSPRFTIRFGEWEREEWSPISVGLYVDKVENPWGIDQLMIDIEDHLRGLAEITPRQPFNCMRITAGRTSLTVYKLVDWGTDNELSALLEPVCKALLEIEQALGCVFPS